MLRLEAPRNVNAGIENTTPLTGTVDVTDSPSWLCKLVHQYQRAQNDIRQRYLACGNRFDRDDHGIRPIEGNYQVLYEGGRHVYEVYSK